MKKQFLLLLFLVCSTAIFSQTKKIAWRSHSGKAAAFTIEGNDNFGTTPEMIQEAKRNKAKADSLAMKAKTDSLAMKMKADSLSKKKTLPPKGKQKQARRDSTKVYLH